MKQIWSKEGFFCIINYSPYFCPKENMFCLETILTFIKKQSSRVWLSRMWNIKKWLNLTIVNVLSEDFYQTLYCFEIS